MKNNAVKVVLPILLIGILFNTVYASQDLSPLVYKALEQEIAQKNLFSGYNYGKLKELIEKIDGVETKLGNRSEVINNKDLFKYFNKLSGMETQLFNFISQVRSSRVVYAIKSDISTQNQFRNDIHNIEVEINKLYKNIYNFLAILPKTKEGKRYLLDYAEFLRDLVNQTLKDFNDFLNSKNTAGAGSAGYSASAATGTHRV